jgi:6-phosphogluconate dehydrogenase
MESVEQGVAAPVLTSALQARFRSQDDSGYSFKLLSMMRNGFGGHAVKKH